MAAPNLPSLPLAGFAQLIPALASREIQHVNRILGLCEYEFPESSYGRCDGFPCQEPAVIHHLESEHEYCLSHFREVDRG
jgi:hypothetical protein